MKAIITVGISTSGKTTFAKEMQEHGYVDNGDVRTLQDLVSDLTERPELLTEDYIDPSHVSEGIIVRVDNGKMTPQFYKSKSYAFRVMEGLCQAEDVEDAS